MLILEVGIGTGLEDGIWWRVVGRGGELGNCRSVILVVVGVLVGGGERRGFVLRLLHFSLYEWSYCCENNIFGTNLGRKGTDFCGRKGSLGAQAGHISIRLSSLGLNTRKPIFAIVFRCHVLPCLVS